MNRDYIILYAKTKLYPHQVEGGWDNIEGMKFAAAATYSSKQDVYRFWKEDQIEMLLKYLNNNLVITFNGIMFESMLLLGNNRTLMSNGTTANGTSAWLNVDIYVEMWRNILNMDKSNYPNIISKMKEQTTSKGVFDLQSIVSATLNKSKSGIGEDWPKLYQDSKPIDLFQYILYDVRNIKKLYEFIKEKRYLVSGSFDIVRFN